MTTEPAVVPIAGALLDLGQQVPDRCLVEDDSELTDEGIRLRVTDVGVVAAFVGVVVTLQGWDGITTGGDGPVADDTSTSVAALRLGGGVGNLPDSDPDAMFLKLGL